MDSEGEAEGVRYRRADTPKTEMELRKAMSASSVVSTARTQYDERRYGKMFRPTRLFIIFSIVNIINYADRGIVAGVVTNLGCPCSCQRGSELQTNLTVTDCCPESYQVSEFQNGDQVWSDNSGNYTCISNVDPTVNTSTTCCHDGSLTCVTDCAKYGFGNFDVLDAGATGALGSAFMGGYIVASPIVASLVYKFKPFKLMGTGLAIWFVSILGTALAPNYYILLAARILSGVGEASFQCVTPPFIDDYSAKEKKGIWLSLFFSAIPVGYAVGYALSGFLASVGPDWWRMPFIVEACIMLPFIVFSFFVPLELEKHKDTDEISDSSSESGDHHNNVKDMIHKEVKAERNLEEGLGDDKESVKVVLLRFLKVMKNKVFLCISLGYAAYTFVIGGLSFFGPTYVVKALLFEESVGNLLIGGVTGITGLVGTFIGGIILDKFKKSDDEKHFLVTATLQQTVYTVVGLPFLLGGTFVTFNSAYAFFILLFVGQLLLFACTTLTNASIMWAVNADQRPSALAVSTIMIHLLGDVPSPVLVGLLTEGLENARVPRADSWAIFMLGCWLAFTIIFWLLAYIFSKVHLRKREQEEKSSDEKVPLMKSGSTDEPVYGPDSPYFSGRTSPTFVKGKEKKAVEFA
uniref:Major facilitator superfamily (MFS) profile domain-containing protein n=1 Tax=Palpitomonas bilix TaxID=652834 RepID=A0A7S3D8Q6_9EUKA